MPSHLFLEGFEEIALQHIQCILLGEESTAFLVNPFHFLSRRVIEAHTTNNLGTFTIATQIIIHSYAMHV